VVALRIAITRADLAAIKAALEADLATTSALLTSKP
jgi:hypothetical protein